MGNLTTPPPTRPTAVRYGVLGFICVLALITYLDRICIMRASEDIQNDLGIDKVAMGLVFSAFLLGYTLFEVPGGWLGDRWGTRKTLFGIVLAWSLFTALTGCVWPFLFDTGFHLSITGVMVPIFGSLLALLVIRFLFGTAEAGAFPNMARVIGTWFPYHERARAQGLLWMCARLGGGIAPPILGWLSLSLGWRPAFWVLGAVGVAWALVFVFWFRNRPSEMARCNEAERKLIETGGGSAVSSSGHGHEWPPLRVMVRSTTFWGLCAAACFVCFGWYFFPTWQPYFYKEAFGIEVRDSAWWTGLPLLVGAFGALLGGQLSDYLIQKTGNRRRGRSLVGMYGFLGAGVCMMLSGFATAPWQAVVLFCLASFLNDLAIPVIWAATTDVSGRYVGTVTGIMNTAGGIGGVISPALIPQVQVVLADRYSPSISWRFILVGLACAWFVAAFAWLFIDASKTLTEEPTT